MLIFDSLPLDEGGSCIDGFDYAAFSLIAFADANIFC